MSYWENVRRSRISRRRLIQATGLGSAGLAAAMLIGCGGGNDNTSSSSSSSGSGAAPTTAASTSGASGSSAPLAADQKLKVRFYDDPGGFDPATIFRVENENIAFNVYSALTTYEPESGKVIPDLATGWEQPDATTLNFKIVNNATFHKDFGKMTAEDVVYSFKRMLDPATSATYAAEFNNLDSVTAPDETTVVVKLKGPDANFLHQVANYHQGQVVSQAAIEKYGKDYKFNPIGTGPFVFDSFTPAQQILLKRHEGYFKAPATLEQIDFQIIKDDNTAAIALQNGEVALAMRISQNDPLKRVMDTKKYTMNSRTGYAVSLTIFNLENQNLKDQRVRYAYAHAIDYDTVLKTVAPLTSSPFYNILPDWMDVFSPDVPKYAYDQKMAQSLMDQAGVKAASFDDPVTSVSEQTQLEQSYLDKVGIKRDYRIVDTPTWTGVRSRGEFDICGRLLPAINPDTILFSYLHPDNIAPKGLNGARYNNPQLTSLLESARAELDFEKRKALYAQVQKIALTDLPYLPTSTGAVFWPGEKWVSGVAINPLSQVNFYDVKLLAH